MNEPGDKPGENQVFEGRPATSLATLETIGALTPIGLSLPATTTPEQFMALARTVSKAQTMLAWVRGDMIVFAEAIWGEEGYQFLEELDGSEMSKSQWGRVATRFPAGRRNASLSWSHHRAVVALEPDEADRFLRQAASMNWSRNQLEDEIAIAHPKATEPATGYVVEAVLDAAEEIYDAATSQQRDDESWFCVPAERMEDLGRALGKIE